MTELERRRRLLELGQRAVDYYIDTGLCVFCNADDVTGAPHDDDCDVGRVSGVVLTPKRKAEKAEQRALVHEFVRSRVPLL